MFPLRPWRVGKLLGIPIGIDPSWILIFLLVTYQLAAFVFPFELGLGRRRGLSLEPIWLAVIASLLLFASVLAHEFSHAYMALKRGVPVLGITLFIFGGVAQIGDEPDSPLTELLIAVMGPLMSLLIAILSAAVWVWSQAFTTIVPGTFRTLLPVAIVSFYLAQTNLLLALFNLLPGFPLDGGRVLRAGLGALFKNMRRATFWSMVMGRVVAVGLLAVGAVLVFRGELGGAWMFLVAWFLWRAAGESYHSLLARELLKQVPVGQLMRGPRLALVPERAVAPDDTALAALQLMMRRDADPLAVVQDGQVVGTIGREELAAYLRARGE